MSHILKYNTWNALLEQDSSGFSCDTAWYKGDELTTENFGKVLSCSRKSFGSAYEFWTNTSGDNKEYILSTLKEGNKDLSKYGLASKAAAMKQASKMPKSYRLDGAFYSKITRGEKSGTEGFYLDGDNNIYIENSVGSIKSGANNIMELISTLNTMNRENYINGKTQIRIGKSATEAKLNVDGKVYKGLQYKLEEMSTFEGFIFYPTLPDPVEKVVRKKEVQSKVEIPQFVTKQPEPFKDNSIEPTPAFLEEVKQYFRDILIRDGGTITDLSIESGASNKRTTYPEPKETGTYTWKKNFKLAEDRGNNLYKILSNDPEFKGKIPAMKTPVKTTIQECGSDGDTAPCKIPFDDKYKKLVITASGYYPKIDVKEYTTNQIAYSLTHWRLRQS